MHCSLFRVELEFLCQLFNNKSNIYYHQIYLGLLQFPLTFVSHKKLIYILHPFQYKFNYLFDPLETTKHVKFISILQLTFEIYS